MILRNMTEPDAAINEESWEWLTDNLPVLAGAISREVGRGSKPNEIRRHVLQRTHRDALAMRYEQAAEHLIWQNGNHR